ncbi:MAG: cytochrome ubiquinol oxidase subunit I [bacterium]|nr:cytochrome ubiquinol oxidase subunit I [bacterium]
MDVVLLSRIQFAVAAGFHFIFPPLSIGISLIITALEVLYYKKGDEIYKKTSTFLIKIFGLIFTMGVSTGIVLEFSFGTNWSQYSRAVGDIFGSPLAAEGIFSFFLESVFLGVLLFGRNRVSKGVYCLSAFLVAFGSHLSGLWIIIANSWMQTPAGYVMENGRAVLTNFMDAALNPSTLVRYFHVILAAWIVGSLFTAGLSSWYLLKDKFTEYFRPLLKIAMLMFIGAMFLLLVSGHAHSVQVAETQPVKMAAFEALWDTQEGAPMSIIGIPDESAQKTHFEIAVPKLLSLLISFDPNSKVQGLNDFPEEDRPPVFLPYMSYHLMVGLGMLFFGIAALGILLLMRKKLYDTKWYQKILFLAAPLPIIACEVGWIAAEVGRQPWVVYGELRTVDAVSVVVPAWQVLFSLIMFSLIYVLLFTIFVIILKKIVKKGPEDALRYS